MTNNKQIPINNQQLTINSLVVVICVLFGAWNLVFAVPVSAQTLGLSISPPIDEVMIIPGKAVTQTFTITNEGEDGMASLYILPFRPQGEYGGVALDEKNAVTNGSLFASWFSIISPVTGFGEKFFIGGGQSKNVNIKISPPESAPEKDYYFTLLYELDNVTPDGYISTGATGRARIGSNLLLSVSKDGKPGKNPNIVEFSAPKIIDSLQKLDYKVRVGNDGTYLFKSNGQITVKPMIGDSQKLSLTPLNVIAGSVRNVSCINGEEIVPCQLGSKVLIGIYKSTLKIEPDGGTPLREETRTTIAFPFSITLGVIFVIITYGIIKKSQKHGKESS